jgi:hypothetical protein
MILIITMAKTVPIITAQPILGVPVFFLWSFANSVAFPIVASSRICFQSLRECMSFIKSGKNINQTINVVIQNENISMRLLFIYKREEVYMLNVAIICFL